MARCSFGTFAKTKSINNKAVFGEFLGLDLAFQQAIPGQKNGLQIYIFNQWAPAC